jgi:hypothetical protein
MPHYEERLSKIYAAVVPTSREELGPNPSQFAPDYRVLLVNEGEHDLIDVKLYTGGFEGTGDSFTELNRSGRSLGALRRGDSLRIDELDIYILDFFSGIILI